MFDIGFSELLLLAVVALLVLGPERLPGAARTAGALLRRLREGWNSVRTEVENELRAEDLKRSIHDNVQRARSEFESTVGDVRRGVDETVDGVRRAAGEAREQEPVEPHPQEDATDHPSTPSSSGQESP